MTLIRSPKPLSSKYPSLDRSIGEDQRPFRRLVVVVVSRFEHGIVKELTESIIFYLLCGLSPLVAQVCRDLQTLTVSEPK